MQNSKENRQCHSAVSYTHLMENLITQINTERLVNSDTALMVKELYYYVPCEYWYDKLDRLRTDVEGDVYKRQKRGIAP